MMTVAKGFENEKQFFMTILIPRSRDYFQHLGTEKQIDMAV